MTIVIAILKIVGIILLMILGTLVLLILLALFFPVGYSVLGISEEDVVVKGKIHWLFHLIAVHFLYEKKEFSSEIRLFGIHLKKKEPKLTAVYNEYDIEDETEGGIENETEQFLGSKDKIPIKEEAKQDNLARKNAKNKKGISFRNTIVEKYKAIKQSIYHFRKILQNMKKKGTEWIGVLIKEENKRTMLGILGELKYLLKHFGIRKIRSDLSFSTGDPAMTGQVLGGLCLLPFLYQKGVHVSPDFESDEFYIKGELEASGHLRAIHILRSGIHLWKDKNLREIIKSMLK